MTRNQTQVIWLKVLCLNHPSNNVQGNLTSLLKATVHFVWLHVAETDGREMESEVGSRLRFLKKDIMKLKVTSTMNICA